MQEREPADTCQYGDLPATGKPRAKFRVAKSVRTSFAPCGGPGFRTPCFTRIGTSFSHNPAAIHRPFRPPVGVVGNQGRRQRSPDRFSKTPEFHIRDFRKLAHPLNLILHNHFGMFPTFPTELRVLLSFPLISYPFPTPVAPLQPSNKPNHLGSAHAAMKRGSMTRSQLRHAVIQRTAPVFHAH